MAEILRDFNLPANTAVFVCQHVAERKLPVLRVTHDADGDWQFLCGGDHGDGSGDVPKLWALSEILKLEPELSLLGDMCVGHTATKTSPAAGWLIHDDGEDAILADIEKFGWHDVVVSPGEKPEQVGFAYSVGIFKSWNLPEIVTFGLPPKVAHSTLWRTLELMQKSGPLADGSRTLEVFENVPAVVRTVARKHYTEHFGYALWYYKSVHFPVMQIYYPDRIGRFPWDHDCEPRVRSAQPLLFD
jgi:hypothetical protein